MRVARLAALLVLAAATAACQEHSLSRQQLSGLGPVEAVVCTNQIALQLDAGTPPTERSGRSPITVTPSSAVDRNTAAILNGAGSALWRISQASNYESSFRDLNKRAAAILQELRGYDFDADLLQAMQVELAKVDSTNVEVRPAVVTTGCSGPMRQAVYEQSTASTVLLIAVHYRLRDRGGAHVLSFSSRASIFSKTNALWDARRMPDPGNPVSDGNAVYNRFFDYDFVYDGRTRPRTVFSHAARSLAARLAADLNRP